jgi:putative two-component system response regulator
MARQAFGSTGPEILVVEDDAGNQKLLMGILGRHGYGVSVAADGATALDQVASGETDLVLLDLGLPVMDGFEVCRRLRSDPRQATLPVIVLTGRTDHSDIVAALDAGATDFVAKPFAQAELLARIRSALRLRQAYKRTEAAHAVVATLANAIEAKDSLTQHHCQRLAFLATKLAVRAGVDPDELENISLAAMLHDIGKIGVSESVLSKPGPLNEAEWEEMRTHSGIGARICAPLAAGDEIIPIIRHHHERWDGSGYPDGLRTTAIPLGARIIAIGDAFDAMTNDRPYRPRLSVERAVEELVAHTGRQFDPHLAPLFIQMLDEGPLEGFEFHLSNTLLGLDNAALARVDVGAPLKSRET